MEINLTSLSLIRPTCKDYTHCKLIEMWNLRSNAEVVLHRLELLADQCRSFVYETALFGCEISFLYCVYDKRFIDEKMREKIHHEERSSLKCFQWVFNRVFSCWAEEPLRANRTA